MHITTKDNKNTELIMDTNGNIYILYNGLVYDFNITNTNNLTLDMLPNITQKDIDDNIVKPDDINKGELKLVDKEGSLKSRIVRDKLKEKYDSEKVKDDEEIEAESDEDDKYVEEKYNNHYYENNTYLENYKNDSDDETEKVFFLGSGISEIRFINYGDDDDVPIYDTLIYNGDMKTGEPILKTKLTNIEPIYRLKIYKSGNIVFRPIGNKEQTYELISVEDKLTLRSYLS